MTLLQYVFLLQFATTFAFGQQVHPSRSSAKIVTHPESVVQSLYREVVARHPIGIPKKTNMKVIAPYLSKGLIRRIDLAIGCEDDYYRQHQTPDEKPEFAWLELGLFTGGDEKALPRAFRIERTQPEKDGFFYVYLRLTYGMPESPLTWHVAAIVVREDGRFVIDDVIYLKDKTRDIESRLSQTLTSGCDGSRWIGYDKPRNDFRK